MITKKVIYNLTDFCFRNIIVFKLRFIKFLKKQGIGNFKLILPVERQQIQKNFGGRRIIKFKIFGCLLN